MAGTKVRVASWNIWVYGKRDYKGIAEFIRKNKIDIVGIQEAAVYYDKKPNLDMAQRIAKELGYGHASFPAFDYRPKDPFIMQNAIISRFPIIGSKHYELNPSWMKESAKTGEERRILVSARIKFPRCTVNFLTAHLQPSLRFEQTKIRIYQAQKIVSIVKKLKRHIILTGDFNSVPKNRDIGLLKKELSKVGGDTPTWSTVPFDYGDWHVHKPTYKTDYIFVSRDLKARNFAAIKNKLSDHLPVMADILIP